MRYIFCKYFHPVCGFYFYSLEGVCHKAVLIFLFQKHFSFSNSSRWTLEHFVNFQKRKKTYLLSGFSLEFLYNGYSSQSVTWYVRLKISLFSLLKIYIFLKVICNFLKVDPTHFLLKLLYVLMFMLLSWMESIFLHIFWLVFTDRGYYIGLKLYLSLYPLCLACYLACSKC